MAKARFILIPDSKLTSVRNPETASFKGLSWSSSKISINDKTVYSANTKNIAKEGNALIIRFNGKEDASFKVYNFENAENEILNQEQIMNLFVENGFVEVEDKFNLFVKPADLSLF